MRLSDFSCARCFLAWVKRYTQHINGMNQRSFTLSNHFPFQYTRLNMAPRATQLTLPHPLLTYNDVVALQLLCDRVGNHHHANIVCEQVHTVVPRYRYSYFELSRQKLPTIDRLGRVCEVGTELVECTILTYFGVLLESGWQRSLLASLLSW